MVTPIIALLLSLGSFVFALLVWTESHRTRREHHRSVALASTHTAELLLDEAVTILDRVDGLVRVAGLELGEDAERRYEDYRRTVLADQDKVAKAMIEIAFGTLSIVECRSIAASSTLITRRTIAGRREVLDVLHRIRAQLAAG